jgi:ketosteroid isomerase-like protein
VVAVATGTISKDGTGVADAGAVVAAGLTAAARGDVGGFAAMFHPDATWNHRNNDRLGGVKAGVDEILRFFAESTADTAGTLRPMPQVLMSDDAGHVAVLARVSGARPDGRTFDDTQILFFTVADGRVRSVDQFVGAPAAVAAFWA